MASINYSGRIVDLLIFQGTVLTGDKQVELGFGDGGGKIITGIGKLSQSYAILFLTERGTVQYDPELGTEFITAVKLGTIQDEADVRSEFLSAKEFIRQTLDLANDQNELPEDEQYQSSNLDSFEIDKQNSLLKLFITVTSVAGASREVFLPIPLAIQ